jgi:outer membrane murein-binding lipoprotein Lpp
MVGQIASKTTRAKKNIPRFQCTFSSPFDINPEDNTRISTKTDALECRQKDAKELKQLLEKTYQDGTFMFFKVRHIKPEIFRSAIRKQNAFLARSRTVPIQGISEDVMFCLENDLLQITGVREVLRHKLTATKGRWSIMTNDQHFKDVTDLIKRELTASVAHYSEEFPIPSTFPPVGLAFKSREYDDESSGGSFNTYLSACSTIFSERNMEFSSPPETSSPAIQAWGPTPPKIPREVQSTTETQVESGLSSDNYHHADREKERMSREIQDLKAQVKTLLQKAKGPDPPPPPELDMAALIAATADAVMQRMIANQNKEINTQRKDKQAAGSDANTAGIDLDMSLDSPAE